MRRVSLVLAGLIATAALAAGSVSPLPAAAAVPAPAAPDLRSVLADPVGQQVCNCRIGYQCCVLDGHQRCIPAGLVCK